MTRVRWFMRASLPLAVAAALGAAAAAQSADTCAGVFKVGGSTARLAFVYATVDRLFSEPSKEYLRVVLSDVALPPETATDDFALQKLTRDRRLHAVVLIISPNKQIASTQLYDAAFNMDSASSSGTNHQFDATQMSRDRVAGKAFTKAAAEFRSVQYEYAATFDAAVRR